MTSQHFLLRHFPSTAEALNYCVDDFIRCAQEAIQERDRFTVALSGGSTPKAIYERLADAKHRTQVDWSRVWLFWSDERSVPPDHPDSNYRMAMQAGLSTLSIPAAQIHRMAAESDLPAQANAYEQLIVQTVPEKRFDLIMLGMGDDGHTASLFPHTEGLQEQQHLVIPNFVPKLNTWRMTLTFACINAARHLCVYVLGRKKADMLAKVLRGPFQPNELPSQRLGTPENPAVWISDFALPTN